MSNSPNAAAPVVVAAAAPKPGYLTSEFWLSVASVCVGALVAVSVVPASDEAEVEGMVDAVISAIASKNVVAFLMAVVPVFTYIRSRGVLKSLFAKLQFHAQAAAVAKAAQAEPEPVVLPAPAQPVAVAPAPSPAADPFKV